MQTDWVLVRRLASELDERLRGARIATAGLLPDGRFALDVRGGTARRARLVADVFAPTPLVWIATPALESLDLRAAPGWSRALAEGLEGRRIERIRGRTGDRLIALDARSRSRFGVDHDVRLVIELTPKFGNLLLLKDGTIIAAAREFRPTAAARSRTAVTGGTYEPPPLPEARPDAEAERLAFTAYATAASRPLDEAAVAPLVRAVRRDRPALTPLLAQSIVAELRGRALASGAELRTHLTSRADALLAAAEGRDAVHVYRRDGALVQAHVVPLAGLDADPALVHTRIDGIADVACELAERVVAPDAKDSFQRRRAQLAHRLERRRASVAALLETALSERVDDGESDRLRLAGDALYAHQDEVAPGATSFHIPEFEGPAVALDPALDARANAAAIFKRYRKVTSRRGHAERRAIELEAGLARLDELAWELARAEPETLAEITHAIDELLPAGVTRAGSQTRTRPHGRARPAALRPHRIELGSGARILVGRSPGGNDEVTFRLARPDDWWFHARGIPGAHVVLQLDEAREPTDDELQRAAEAAAAYSSAAASDRVEIDLTRRKYVRKRETGPGQVWYVNARTIAAVPRLPQATAGAPA